MLASVSTALASVALTLSVGAPTHDVVSCVDARANLAAAIAVAAAEDTVAARADVQQSRIALVLACYPVTEPVVTPIVIVGPEVEAGIGLGVHVRV